MRVWVVLLLLASPGLAQAQSDGSPTTFYWHMSEAVIDGLSTTATGASSVPSAAPGSQHSLCNQGPAAASGHPYTQRAVLVRNEINLDGEFPVFELGRQGAQADLVGAVRFWFYLEWDDGQPVDVPATPLPDIVLRTTMRENLDDWNEVDLLDHGELMAQAENQPALLAGDATSHPEVTYLGDDLYEVQYETDLIRTQVGDSFNLRLDLFMDSPACTNAGQDFLHSGMLRMLSTTEHQSRMELQVANPLQIWYASAQAIGDDIVVLVTAESPWGHPDILETRVEANRPGTWEPALVYPTPASPTPADYQAGHAFTPELREGTFEFNITVETIQGETARLVRNYTYPVTVDEWGPNPCASITLLSCPVEPKPTPSLAPGIVLLALALLAWRRGT